MVHGSYRDLVEEKENLEHQKLFKGLNKQRDKEQVISALRQKEINFTDLAFHDKAEALSVWSQKDAEYRKLEALESIAEDMRKLLTDTRLRYVRKGQVYGNQFTLTQTAGLCLIDLIHPESSINPPPIFNISTPRRPIPRVTFINYGPTGVLFVNTNLDYNNDTKPSLAILPPAASTPPIPFVIDTGEPVIERINLLATGADIPINVIFEI